MRSIHDKKDKGMYTLVQIGCQSASKDWTGKKVSFDIFKKSALLTKEVQKLWKSNLILYTSRFILHFPIELWQMASIFHNEYTHQRNNYIYVF